MFNFIFTIVWCVLLCMRSFILCIDMIEKRPLKMDIFWVVFCAFWFIFEALKVGGYLV